MPATAIRSRALFGCAAALLLAASVGGCSSPAPSGTVIPSAATPAPSATGKIELHALDPRYVPAAALASANGQVLWSAGTNAAPELWRFVPGAGAPEELYVSPNADATITDVVAAEPGYAFVETSMSAYGDGGWRVWFLAQAGGEPVELDRGLAPGAGSAPTIAMNDAWIAWAAFDEPASGPVSRLRIVPTSNPTAATTLIDHPINDGLLWYPALDRDDLWYAVIHADVEGTGAGDEFHLESLTLPGSGAPPTVFRGPGKDFDPAVNDEFVVWKTAEGDSAALNWGTLHFLDRRTQAVGAIPVKNAIRPSIGDRYVAFDEITHSRLLIFDPSTPALVALGGADTPAAGSVGGESLSGRLLAFFTQQDGAPPRIGWATLPE